MTQPMPDMWWALRLGTLISAVTGLLLPGDAPRSPARILSGATPAFFTPARTASVTSLLVEIM